MAAGLYNMLPHSACLTNMWPTLEQGKLFPHIKDLCLASFLQRASKVLSISFYAVSFVHNCYRNRVTGVGFNKESKHFSLKSPLLRHGYGMELRALSS